MKTIILCGGQGTRMKEETEYKPKPLVLVGGKPILWHIMKIYSHYGYNEFILALGYKGEMIKDYFLNWRTFLNDFTLDAKNNQLTFHNNDCDDFKITFAETGLETLTGERVRLLKKYIGDEDFMVTYGDGVADIDIKKLVDFHQQQNTIGTITGVHKETSRFGLIAADANSGKAIGYQQDKIGDLVSVSSKDYINGGFMVFKNEFFDFIKPDSMIEQAFPLLTGQKQLSIFSHEGKWKCMDTYKEVEEMNVLWKENPFWKVWENGVFYGEPIKKLVEQSNLTNKNILVTGATGLVGPHLVEQLLNLKPHKIVCLIRSKDPKSYFYTNKLDEKVVCAYGDLNDKERIFNVVTKYEIDYIFHVGAQAIVPTAIINPAEAVNTNVVGTLNILEAARLSPLVKGVVVASSDKAYGKQCDEAIETEPMAGEHPYDASKSCTDLLARTYAKTYNLPVAISRFGNIYGPGDLNANRIIPGIMKAVLTGEVLELRSDGTFVRDYVYVKDVVDGYIKMAEQIHQIKGEAFNFGAGHNFSVLELIQKIGLILNKKIDYRIVNNQKNEIPTQSLNSDKARQILKWQPVYTFDQGIKSTFEWYKKHLGR